MPFYFTNRQRICQRVSLRVNIPAAKALLIFVVVNNSLVEQRNREKKFTVLL